MDCREFETRIDQYVDAMLPHAEMVDATGHVDCCTGCNELVTTYQHASALLRTAVADKAAAVDVSGLWESIEARLDEAPVERRDRVGLVARILGLDLGGRLQGLLIGVLGPAPLRAGAFAAAAAAVALILLSGGGIGLDEKAKSIASKAGTAAGESPTVVSRHDPDSRPRAKHVRIDNLGIAEGHKVATWSRPRTRTQVIWVNSPDDPTDGPFGVSNAAAGSR